MGTLLKFRFPGRGSFTKQVGYVKLKGASGASSPESIREKGAPI